MDAMEEIRHLLDERGVKWTSGDTEVSRNICTNFCPDAGVSMSVWENDGKLGIDAHTLYRFTPEQAIAATLGPGTCRMKLRRNPYRDFLHEYTCSECGETMCKHTFFGKSVPPRWCPNCGRKVVED